MRQEQEAVSGDPKTLTLTFQEAVELLGRDYRAALVFLPYSPDQLWDAWSTLSIDEEGYAVEDFAPTWEETMSGILGVRVVARDEASELRAAAQRYIDALDRGRHLDVRSARGLEDAFEVAEATTAIRAALAATEGSES